MTDYAPPRFGRVLAAVAGFAAALLAGVSTAAFLGGCLAVVVLLIGAQRGSRIAVLVGAGGMFAAVLFAAAAGVPTPLLLGATAAAVVAYDAAEGTVTLGRRVAPGVDTVRLELVHAGGTLAVAAVGLALAYALFVAVDALPPGATAALYVGAVALAARLVVGRA